jgi:hypothetical protein
MAEMVDMNVAFDFDIINPNSRNILGEFVYRNRDGHAFCITNRVYDFHGNLNLLGGEEEYMMIRRALDADRYIHLNGFVEHGIPGLTVVEPFTFENTEYYIGDAWSFSHRGRLYDTQTLDLVGTLENGAIVYNYYGH